MKYCCRCLIPETRPNIGFDEHGVCHACRFSDHRPQVDWEERRRLFHEIARQAKSRRKAYDCLIPVSGGKDSTWQVVTLLEAGLKPLAVSWAPPCRTELGRRNLANLIALGVDHIDFRINPDVERRFFLRALERFGAVGIPMHMAIFNIALKTALRFDTPLVVWGENSAAEYGGTEKDAASFRMTREWLSRFGVSNGTTAADWIDADLTAEDLEPYFGPSDEALAAAGIQAVFLGHFFPWDTETSLKTALAHGFQVRPEGPRIGIYNYADLDDPFISLHHFMKWYKFGFTRSFDNLSIEIRRGRITRDEAIARLRERGDETPHEDIDVFCDFVGITRDRFWELCEGFRDPAVWKQENGRWIIPDFLVPDWNWR